MVDGTNRRELLKYVAGGTGALGLAGGVSAQESKNIRQIVGTKTKKGFEGAKKKANSVHRTLDFGNIGKAVVGDFPVSSQSALQSHNGVKYIENDKQMQALDQTTPWGVDRVDADVAHTDGYTGGSADIAILDTGIDADHPDLKDNLGEGTSYYDCDSDCTEISCDAVWDDDNGHGTHCAGIANAVNNSEGVVGVSTEATLHAVKVLDCGGYGSYSAIAAGVEYATNQGWDVASMSLGGGSSSYALKDACQYAANNGTLVVAAAGNSGPCNDCVMYPAKYNSVIAVSATENNDNLASYSSTGPEIDVAAPGSGIYSTWPGGYFTVSGTSMACPHVAGAAGLLMANGYTNTEARARLQETAEDIGLGDNEQGYGLLDAEAAVGDDDNESMIGEAGRVSAKENWKEISLDGTYTDPVVVTSVETHNDPEPVHARVRNAATGSFEVKLEEWEYQDGTHTNETVSYVVIESGEYSTSAGMDVLAGKVTADGSDWTTATFSPDWNAQSHAYTQVMSDNDSTATSARITRTARDSFDVSCQVEQDSRPDASMWQNNHGSETIGFIVTQPIVGDAGEGGESIASSILADEWKEDSLQGSYSETPVMVHRMQSFFGQNTSNIRSKSPTSSTFEIMVQEEQSYNDEVRHVQEYIATLAFESGPISAEY